jgi:hypothetical protein
MKEKKKKYNKINIKIIEKKKKIQNLEGPDSL